MTGEKVLGWAIDADGRLTEGPFKGFLTRSPQREDKLVLSEAEWKARLTAEQFRILRNHGTEAAFCGVFHDHKADGYYKVVTTEHRVFKSDAKFDSGTGWPSFFQPYDRDAIWLRPDFSYGMTRMEVLDSLTDGHLGHVFEDGPRDKSGLRFCINSEVLEFVPAKL
ncbi:MAG: peptide-methionine (R)-S-oxide reductase MsrB [Fimbriimonadaceae bacterium]|nr:peptide-methionine (R)-S-oxide reductase MsrB [Fimbriimonadaceae bacterium]